MSLTERTHVSIEAVRQEIFELQEDYRLRSKTLKALLRVLEAEAGLNMDTTTDAEPKGRKKGAKAEGVDE